MIWSETCIYQTVCRIVGPKLAGEVITSSWYQCDILSEKMRKVVAVAFDDIW